jgi:hypothetical protein
MSVYVDQLYDYGWRLGASCQMIADSLDELHALANRVGLRRSWFQAPPKASFPHYDLTESRRTKAIALGAVSLSRREFVMKMRKFRATQTGATP